MVPKYKSCPNFSPNYGKTAIISNRTILFLLIIAVFSQVWSEIWTGLVFWYHLPIREIKLLKKVENTYVSIVLYFSYCSLLFCV